MARSTKLGGVKEGHPLSMTFSLKSREYASAIRYRTRRIPAVFIVLAASSAAGGALMYAAGEAAVAVVILLLPSLMTFAAGRQFRESCEHRFDDEGHTCTSPTELVHHSWQRFDSYTETPRLFLIRSHKSIKVIVPKRIFETVSEERKFRVLLATHLSTVSRHRAEKRPEAVTAPRRQPRRKLTAVTETPTPGHDMVATQAATA